MGSRSPTQIDNYHLSENSRISRSDFSDRYLLSNFVDTNSKRKSGMQSTFPNFGDNKEVANRDVDEEINPKEAARIGYRIRSRVGIRCSFQIGLSHWFLHLLQDYALIPKQGMTYMTYQPLFFSSALSSPENGFGYGLKHVLCHVIQTQTKEKEQ